MQRIHLRYPASRFLFYIVNTLRNPTSEALYFGQVLIGAAIAILIMILSYRAYRDTKFIGFVPWIASSFLSLCTIVGWDIVGHAYPYPRIYPAAVIVYRTLYLVISLISVTGTILVIRQFVHIFKKRKL